MKNRFLLLENPGLDPLSNRQRNERFFGCFRTPGTGSLGEIRINNPDSITRSWRRGFSTSAGNKGGIVVELRTCLF
jgi:hypothetical protein